jgi:hypothetical protein
MSYSLSNKKFNQSVHEYLLNCDLTNKYNLKNIYKKPKLEKVILHFPINNLPKSHSSGNNLQVKSFLIFHILFFTLSFINFGKIKISNHSNSGVDPQYSLKILLLNQEDINLFLLNLLVENFSLFENKSLSSKASTTTAAIPLIDSFCYNVSIPGKAFFDVDDFFSRAIKETHFKELNIQCSFLVKNVKNCKNLNHAIKNTSLFLLNR